MIMFYIYTEYSSIQEHASRQSMARFMKGTNQFAMSFSIIEFDKCLEFVEFYTSLGKARSTQEEDDENY